MTVELLAVGTEILLGNIVNTNAAYLAEKCALLGLSLYHQGVVGDNPKRLKEALELALERADIVILCGGLGPTKDDLTKEITAEVFGKKLSEDAHSKERIQSFFEKIDRPDITENNWKQALIPEGATVIDNHNGTAPGLIVSDQGKTAILLPGPPNELKPMFERDIYPYLNALQPEGIYSKMIKICSVGESKAETMIADILEAQSNPTVAPYAKTGEVHLRVTAKACDRAEAEQLMAPVIEELYRRFGDAIYSDREEETLEAAVVALLKEKGMTLTTAESCTGGLLSGRIINVSGVSEVYKEGYITYSNEAKEKLLGVDHALLEQYGAVSEEVAAAMAKGARQQAGTDAAISVTGIAGPEGGSAKKPVGLVYIGCAVQEQVTVYRFQFTGNREKNRDYAVVRALIMLREQLMRR